MTINETITMTTSIAFSENKEHRYSLTKEWNNSKKSVCVIMLAAGSADCVEMDLTTLFCINNAYRLDFGRINIVNLFSKVNAQLKSNPTFENLTDESNNNAILQAVEQSDTAIICWGKASNKKITARATNVLKLLEPHKDKLFELHGIHGEEGFHPLHPSLRSNWILKPFPMLEIPQEESEAETSKEGKKGRKKAVPQESIHTAIDNVSEEFSESMSEN